MMYQLLTGVCAPCPLCCRPACMHACARARTPRPSSAPLALELATAPLTSSLRPPPPRQVPVLGQCARLHAAAGVEVHPHRAGQPQLARAERRETIVERPALRCLPGRLPACLPGRLRCTPGCQFALQRPLGIHLPTHPPCPPRSPPPPATCCACCWSASPPTACAPPTRCATPGWRTTRRPPACRCAPGARALSCRVLRRGRRRGAGAATPAADACWAARMRPPCHSHVHSNPTPPPPLLPARAPAPQRGAAAAAVCHVRPPQAVGAEDHRRRDRHPPHHRRGRAGAGGGGAGRGARRGGECASASVGGGVCRAR